MLSVKSYLWHMSKDKEVKGGRAEHFFYQFQDFFNVNMYRLLRSSW